MKSKSIKILFLLSLLFSNLSSCQKKVIETIPTIGLYTVSNITTTSAFTESQIISTGNAKIISCGLCWSLNTNPTISDKINTFSGTISKSFKNLIIGLKPGTKYYLRAYAINQVGVAYSNERNFKTLDSLPELTTGEISNITSISASCNCIIINDGGSYITSRGVCWSINQNPTIENDKSNDGIGIGNFTSSLIILSPGTKYFVRSYAINNIGIGYGNQMNFTSAICLPEIITISAAGWTATTAIANSRIISDGGSPIIARGVCWSISHNPTINNDKTINGSGKGSFASEVTGLKIEPVYYLRSYATNSFGTGYSSEVSFRVFSWM